MSERDRSDGQGGNSQSSTASGQSGGQTDGGGRSGSRLKRIAKVGALLVVGLALLVGVLFAAGVLGAPDGGLEDNEWGEVEDDRVEVLTTVWIENPNPIGIGGDADVEYTVDLQGVRLAEGEGTDVGVPPGRSTQTLSTDIRNQRLPEWWASHVSNDEVSDLRVDATVHASVGPFSGSPSQTHEDEIDTDIEGALDRSFSEFEGEYSATDSGTTAPDGTPVEPTVEIETVDASWGEVTEAETELHVTAAIHNPNPYPIPTPAFTGEVAFNNISIADWDAGEVELRDAAGDAQIPPGATENRTFVIVMDNENVADWFPTHVENGEYTRVVVTGQLAMEVGDSQVTIPREGDAARCEFDLTTAIFVDDQETDVERDECGLTPVETTREELESAGATLDLTETDWWNQVGDELPGDGNDTLDDPVDGNESIDGGNDTIDGGNDTIGDDTTGDDGTSDGDDGSSDGDDGSSDSDEDSSDPVAAIDANPTQGTAPLTVEFVASDSYDPDGEIVEFAWTFDDGTAATGERVEHTYASPGTYEVELRVVDDDGNTAMATVTVEVDDGI